MSNNSTAALELPPTNPFSSHAVTPGAIPFICVEGQSLDQLVEDFLATGEQGQIVGPHGSGKSTLLAAFLPRLRDLGYHVESIALHDGQRRLPVDFPAPNLNGSNKARTVIVVDGYEQLGRLERWRLRRRCQRQAWGLLVVVHASVGLPTICELNISNELANRVVSGLLDEREFTANEPLIAELLRRHRGNLRDVLFDLYDRYERVR